MTFITDKLEELVRRLEDDEEEGSVWDDFDNGFLAGVYVALGTVIEAEQELEQRTWQAWKNEGVEPR